MDIRAEGRERPVWPFRQNKATEGVSTEPRSRRNERSEAYEHKVR